MFCIEINKIPVLYPFLISGYIWNTFMTLNTILLGITGACQGIIQNGTINIPLAMNRIHVNS